MKPQSLIRSLTLLATLITTPLFAADADVTAHLNKAIAAVRQVASAHGEGRMAGAISEAKCFAVVPDLTEAARVAGGKFGHGVVTCRLANNQWSAPAFFSISGGSVGAQLGIQQKSLVILAMNDAGRNKFLLGEFDLETGAEAAAQVTAGGHSATRSWGDQPLVTYEVSKGLFAGINVRDTNIRRDDDLMDAMYANHVKSEEVLAGKVPIPLKVQPFLREIERAESQ